MTEDFNKWWNSDGLVEDNPYERDTPAFWAWEGWQAAIAAERESVMLMDAPLLLNGQPLYTAPPQREWQGLTDEEIQQAAQGGDTNFWEFCDIIEAKLKEKNT
jgi:hypothetical protein